MLECTKHGIRFAERYNFKIVHWIRTCIQTGVLFEGDAEDYVHCRNVVAMTSRVPEEIIVILIFSLENKNLKYTLTGHHRKEKCLHVKYLKNNLQKRYLNKFTRDSDLSERSQMR